MTALLWFSSAQAGFDDSYKAFQAENYPAALTEAHKAAEGGDPRAYYLLGLMYQGGRGVPADKTEAFNWFQKAANGGIAGSFARLGWAYVRGEGTAQDVSKALDLARLSARANDPEGQFLVHLCLTFDALGYFDEHGKVDNGKYWRLASRSVSERELDSEAMDSLYLAAERNFPMAVSTLALSFGGMIGEGNRKKMVGLIQKIAGQRLPGIERYEKISQYMDTLGESLASPQLFADAQTSVGVMALLKACGVNETPPSSAASSLKQVSMTISRPLRDSAYLPSRVPGYERSYLLAGAWTEEWKYEACGKTAVVSVVFTADGLGGAMFVTSQSGAGIAGIGAK